MAKAREQPLVTIVIPLYNGERFIEQTIDSVLDQDYRRLEIICIIDGTKDKTAEILREYGPDIQVIEQENRGAAYTRNRGLALAQGKYIIFLDQDDFLEQRFISECVHALEREQCIAVAVNGCLIDGNGMYIRKMYRFQKPSFKLEHLFIRNQIFTPSQLMFHRRQLLELGGFDPTITIRGAGPEDWELVIRGVKRDRIHFIDQFLVRYRIHEGNSSRQMGEMLESELRVLAKAASEQPRFTEYKSYRYLQFGYLQSKYHGDGAPAWEAVKKAVRLNRHLLINVRFYWTVGYVCLQGLKRQFTGGNVE